MKKVRFRRALDHDRHTESLALALIQPRHDKDGNRLEGYTADALLAMTPAERERLKSTWLTTAERRLDFQKVLWMCR